MFLAVLLTAGAGGRSAAAEGPTPTGLDFFEKKIRPLLLERCYECHSAEAKKVKGGLRLDTREALLQGGEGGPVIVPGSPEKSRLIEAIRYTNEDLQMPPKEKLTAQQISDFETWIRVGAPDPRVEPRATPYASRNTNHWAFQPPTDHPVPRVRDRRWPKSPIDQFILAELEEKKLKPAPPADKRTLLRRATFDLTGLPPKPEEIDAFLADPSPEAFARAVDRLLDSRHFGERWGRHWLDVARYADSNGLEANVPYPNAWRYRDYVIESFNEDKPFDRFVREQVAGDLLSFQNDQERFEQLIATAFLVLGPKALGEPNREKLTMDVVDDQIDATSKAFLGLTVSCARCHDHKFDPIPTRDYYALAGIFKSTATLSSGAGPRQGPDVPRWMERPLVSAEKAKEIEENQRVLDRLADELRIAIEHPGGIEASKLPGIVIDNMAGQLTGRWKTSQGLTNFVGKDYLHDAKSDKGMMSARFVPNLPHAGQYQVLVAYTPRYDRATNVPVTIQSAEGARTILVNQTLPTAYWNAFTALGLFQFQAGTNGWVTVSNERTQGFVVVDAVQFVPIDEWKLELSAMENASMKAAHTLAAAAQRSDKATLVPVAMRNPMGRVRSPYDIQDAMSELRGKVTLTAPTTMAVQEGSVQNTRVHIRGDVEKLGDEVPRGVLKVLGPPEASRASITPDQSGRLELANWIASRNHPLTARVAVNRVWLHLFGRGLVETPDNFGLLGEKPSHPELLDYLARRFVADSWSVKKLIRVVMLSSAYQMSCEHNPKAYAKDPDNRYLWRMNRRRLDAEAMRDAILATSGQIDWTAGGSTMPTNAPAMNNPLMATPQIVSNRRSVYLPVLRNNVADVFQVFDFVDPHAVTGKRHITTAAPQALFMMNSGFVLEQSRRWAESLLARASSDDRSRVGLAYVLALGRPARPEEVERALRFIEQFQSGLSGAETDAAAKRLLGWQSFCQALLASTEFRFLN